MTRVTAKRRINKALRETTSGLYHDVFWKPVFAAWDAVEALGFILEITDSKYTQDEPGNPISKTWTFEVKCPEFKKPFFGILTAHGAGTVEEPLSKYDITAYVS